MGAPHFVLEAVRPTPALRQRDLSGHADDAAAMRRRRPGELIHIDVKKLGRIVGGTGTRINGGSSHYTGSSFLPGQSTESAE